MRAEHPALVRGGLRWAHADDDTMVFVREHPAGSVLVCARRAPGEAITLPAAALALPALDGAPARPVGDPAPLLATEGAPAPLVVRDGELEVPAGGPGVTLWRL